MWTWVNWSCFVNKKRHVRVSKLFHYRNVSAHLSITSTSSASSNCPVTTCVRDMTSQVFRDVCESGQNRTLMDLGYGVFSSTLPPITMWLEQEQRDNTQQPRSRHTRDQTRVRGLKSWLKYVRLTNDVVWLKKCTSCIYSLLRVKLLFD